MRFTFTSKNYEASDKLKDMTMEKIGRLDRILPENIDVFVTFSSVKIDNTVEVTIPIKGRTLRAEATDLDMLNAVDQAVDALESQMNKYKGQLSRKARIDTSFKEEFMHMFSDFGDDEEEEKVEEQEVIIKRVKRFALKPMDPEEAAMNMDLLGHSFFVFRNAITDEVNVVYKRKDNTYGLIEPEF